MNKNTKILLTIGILSVGGYLLYRSFRSNKSSLVGADGINYAARAKAIKSGRYWEDRDGNLWDVRDYPKPKNIK